MNYFLQRSGFFALAAWAGAGIFALNAQDAVEKSESKARPFTVIWAGGGKFPAVCIGKDNWLVCTIPPGLSEIEASSAPSVEVGGNKISTSVIHVCKEHGICLLETESKLPDTKPFALAGQEKIKPGVQLTSLSSGESCRSLVTGKDFEYLGKNLPCPLLRIRMENDSDHFCRPGTPLINEDGEIHGLVLPRRLKNDRTAHAIPAPVLQKIIWEMEHCQKSGPVWLGFALLTSSTTPEIMQIKDNSPSSRAGLKVGDVILSINGNPIQGMPDIVELIHSLPAETPAKIRILRELKEMNVDVTPAFAGKSAAE